MGDYHVRFCEGLGGGSSPGLLGTYVSSHVHVVISKVRLWGRFCLVSLGVPSESMLSMLVPLLVLPQFLHYVFDAFLWRLHEGDPRWKMILLGGAHQ
jgi:hypothetical protein